MKFSSTKIDGAYLIEPTPIYDDRGMFTVHWGKDFFTRAGIDYNYHFVQSNQSISNKGVLRGLHYQANQWAQGKLVWVTEGSVYDVFVDLRKYSPTYGQWDGYIVKGLTRLWVPQGCAHGFLVLSETANFNYLVNNDYNKESERTLIWNDPDLNIDWNIKDPIMSDKDKLGQTFKDCEKY